jgi:hypothetical protein
MGGSASAICQAYAGSVREDTNACSCSVDADAEILVDATLRSHLRANLFLKKEFAEFSQTPILPSKQ